MGVRGEIWKASEHEIVHTDVDLKLLEARLGE
jgi:hypothetical protein